MNNLTHTFAMQEITMHNNDAHVGNYNRGGHWGEIFSSRMYALWYNLDKFQFIYIYMLYIYTAYICTYKYK